MNELINVNITKTMSSTEIAQLTGKQHGNVLRDIRAMLDQFQDSVLNPKQYQVVTSSNGMTKEILLDKELSMCLMSGYDVNARLKIIRRWQELEAAQAISIPTDYPSALRLAADLAEKNAKLTEKNDVLARKLDSIEDKLFDEREELLIMQTMIYQGVVH